MKFSFAAFFYLLCRATCYCRKQHRKNQDSAHLCCQRYEIPVLMVIPVGNWWLVTKASQTPEHHGLAIHWEIQTKRRKVSNTLMQSRLQGLLAGSAHGCGPCVAVLGLVFWFLRRPSPAAITATTMGSKSLPPTLNHIPLLHFTSALAETCSRSAVCGN